MCLPRLSKNLLKELDQNLTHIVCGAESLHSHKTARVSDGKQQWLNSVEEAGPSFELCGL